MSSQLQVTGSREAFITLARQQATKKMDLQAPIFMGLGSAAVLFVLTQGSLVLPALALVAFVKQGFSSFRQGQKAIEDIEDGEFYAYLPSDSQRDYDRLLRSAVVEDEDYPEPQAIPQTQQPSTVIEAPASKAKANVDAKDKTDLVETISDGHIRSVFTIGPTRTGKSIFITCLAQRFRDKNPGTQLWVFSAKDDPEEAHYWQNYDRKSFCHFMTAAPDEIEDAYREWLELFDQFLAIRGPKILVLDEFSTIGLNAADKPKDSPNKKFLDYMLSKAQIISATGASSKTGIFAISPSGEMQGCGINRSNAGAFLGVFLTKFGDGDWQENVWGGAKNNWLAYKDPPNPTDIAKAKRAGTDLLASLGGKPWQACKRYKVPGPRAKQIQPQKHTQTQIQPAPTTACTKAQLIQEYQHQPDMLDFFKWLSQKSRFPFSDLRDSSFAKTHQVRSRDRLTPYLEAALSCGAIEKISDRPETYEVKIE